MVAAALRFNVYPISQKYASGLDVVELCLYREYTSLVSSPPINTRRDITLVTKLGSYKAGLITYPPSGEVYISPTLYAEKSGKRTTLAKVLDEMGIRPREDVRVLADGDIFRLGT